ncbi:capsular polysaccharide biosynthesis protein [Tateyamaria omphalii]|uniref:Beta-3-deoxy-D-manno-oct-2-ulosonic acid transferase n=1 Tax=Tateyamaria omphalii TaxID=299262 RepID=A0A1P8MW75_9RHOB|nr:capsular polysaccharide biosynthesis protein [Tateyamaria omphalii]APX12346.1 beta-3-deoxy-D-manno-oct-2-ulosonic acid transferase [Tateyamaria omphalii]
MAAGPDGARRLYVYNGGFLARGRVRRIVELAGYDIAVGLPGPDGMVGVWGNSPTAYRGEAVADKRDANLVRVEDAFLRSVLPGRAGSKPIGLLIDHAGVHFDPSTPSDLERILADEPLDNTAVLNTARGAMARMQEAHLSKYTGFDPDAPVPEPGYVLVIDQTHGDASVTASGADRNRFLEMLFVAQDEHPGARILIKTHPETVQGFREGYFNDDNCNDRVSLFAAAVSPWTLMEGAIAVYTVSSGLGFEAIIAGHKPRVFGQPFYAGWGLTADEFPVQRRQRTLTRAQLFAGAMILYPTWYDPHRDCLCDLPMAMEALAAETRAWRADHRGWVASGMRLWKRQPLQKVFGRYKPMRFEEEPGRARSLRLPWMVWAGKADVGHEDALRVEDGFLRSRGLGADLIPPLSLVTDDLGIYYDPSQPSRLEHLIRERRVLRPDQVARVDALVGALTAAGLSKYNLSGDTPDLPMGQRVLVVGQVEDDASIRLGAGEVRTNRALLEAARAARPDAVLIYKPHPDVEAGLRDGAFDAAGVADVVADRADIAALLDAVDELWTMTSLSGFEALLRGVRVVTTGAPFYAGWGLTEDRGAVPPRRREDVPLAGLIHATLIDYPRYFDPVTGTACPVEVVVERLTNGPLPRPGFANRMLSKLQGMLASQAHLWR